MYLEKDSDIQDYKLKQRRLVVPFNITGNATPANKVHSSDLSNMYLSTEGKTAQAAAVDSGTNFTTEDDGTGVFGILLETGASARKVLRISVEQRTGSTATNKDQAIALNGDSSSGITESGNIAFSVTAAGLDLASENFDGVAVIEYVVE